jgi:hypothetical protein
MGTETAAKATRVDDPDAFWTEPLAVWRWDGGTWLVMPPCGHHVMLDGDASAHCCEEEADGTLLLRPNPPKDPGNSNSFLCPRCGWHGYLENGTWRQV